MTKKTSVPSAPTGPMTGGRDDGDASTPRVCLCVTPVTSRMCAPSTAPAALRVKATTRVTETLLPQQPPPSELQMIRRPAEAPPAAPPRTRRFLWTPRIVDPPPLGEVEEDRPP